MGKKEFTSFDTAAVVYELKNTILNSRVSNVYQLDTKTLLLKLHKSDSPPLSLVLEAGRRLHLTSYVLEKPTVPPAFCMALRKYLRNGWLTDIEQYEFERVVVFSFRTKEGSMRLVLELFGDGNFILVGDRGTILQALTYKRMRDRNVLRGESFVFAPPSGKSPFKVNDEELRENLVSLGNVEAVRGLSRVLSIGGVYAEEVLLRAGIEKTKHCGELTDAEIEKIHETLRSLLSSVAGKLEPCVVLDGNGGFVDVVPLMLKRFETGGFQLQTYESFNGALDDFYVRITAVEKATTSARLDELELEAERLKRIVEGQEKTLLEAKQNAEHDRRIGDLIYAHSSDVQALLDRFLDGKQGGKPYSVIVAEILVQKDAGLRPAAYFDSLDSKSLLANVSVDGLAFSLDLRKNLFENAARYYERGKRAKQKFDGAENALDETRRKLKEIQARIVDARELEQGRPVETVEKLAGSKVRPKEWFEKFRWFSSSDGFLVVGGKDAVSNEVLIKKYTVDGDIVFHADVVGAPFVVVKTAGKPPGEECLRQAAEFAAAFSRGWREGFASVDVYWVTPEQLSKAAPSGESVGHGAFVVRGERHWFRGTVLKQGIGVILNEGSVVKFVGGPAESVRAKTKAFAVVVPGDLSGKDLVRRVLGILAGKVSSEFRGRVLKASIEEVREHIPYNKGRIVAD